MHAKFKVSDLFLDIGNCRLNIGFHLRHAFRSKSVVIVGLSINRITNKNAKSHIGRCLSCFTRHEYLTKPLRSFIIVCMIKQSAIDHLALSYPPVFYGSEHFKRTVDGARDISIYTRRSKNQLVADLAIHFSLKQMDTIALAAELAGRRTYFYLAKQLRRVQSIFQKCKQQHFAEFVSGTFFIRLSIGLHQTQGFCSHAPDLFLILERLHLRPGINIHSHAIKKIFVQRHIIKGGV